MVKLVKFIPKHDEQSELHVNPTSVSCIFKDNESDEVVLNIGGIMYPVIGYVSIDGQVHQVSSVKDAVEFLKTK
jgi:hypothetical protein